MTAVGKLETFGGKTEVDKPGDPTTRWEISFSILASEWFVCSRNIGYTETLIFYDLS